jgi:hypothetical protein
VAQSTLRNNRGKGARTQALVAEWYQRLWPTANSQGGGAPGRDVRGVPLDIEVKARKDFEPMAWIRQGRKRARPDSDELPPHVVLRPIVAGGVGENVGEYLVIRRMDDDTAILAELLELRRKVVELGGAAGMPEAASA